MNYIEIKAPAKINIGLYILSKREDGYHNLLTLFYPINDLYDKLTFEKSDQFSFECNSNHLADDSSNLVIKAKNLLEEKFKKNINVKVTLEKKISIGAGLGGGSSDAAATLISLNEMFGLKLDHASIISLALELGSDVPFFIKAKPAIGRSRGELLTELEFKIDKPILIVNPGIHISTKEAFANITPGNTEFDYSKVINEGLPNYELLRTTVSNDFEKYVFKKHPKVKSIKEAMYTKGALFSLMSGSGSTVYGIFDNMKSVEKAFNSFPNHYFKFISNPDQ